MSISTVADSIYTYRFLKLLVTPFEKTKAYELGIVDETGERTDKEITTSEERDAFNLFHRLVFNIKRFIGMLPGGKMRPPLTSYVAALALLRENYGVDTELVLNEMNIPNEDRETISTLLEQYSEERNTEMLKLDENLLKGLRSTLKNRRVSKAADIFLDKVTWPVLSKALEQFGDVLDLNSVELKQKASPKNRILRGQDYMFVINAKPEALKDYPYQGRTHKGLIDQYPYQGRTHKGLIDQSATGKIQRALNQAVKQWEATPDGKGLKKFVSRPRVNFSYAGNGKYQTFNIEFTIGEFDLPEEYGTTTADVAMSPVPMKFKAFLKRKKDDELSEEYLNELFDKPYKFKKINIALKDRNMASLTADSPQGEIYISLQNFARLGDNNFELDFSVGNRFSKTGKGDQFRIFSTVIQGLKMIIDKEKDEIKTVTFSADKEYDDDTFDAAFGGRPASKSTTNLSRSRLYNTMVKKFASKMGFSVDIDDSSERVTVYTLKNKTFKKS